jgi:hypothetical protein
MLCKFVQIKLFKILNRTALTYGCETWELSKENSRTSELFLKENLRRMFGPMRKYGMWWIRCTEEFYREYKDLDLIPCIKWTCTKTPADHLPKKAPKA